MKKLFALLLALALVLGLCGCHGSKDIAKFEVPAEFDTSRNYELVFWAKNESNINQKEVTSDSFTLYIFAPSLLK